MAVPCLERLVGQYKGKVVKTLIHLRGKPTYEKGESSVRLTRAPAADKKKKGMLHPGIRAAGTHHPCISEAKEFCDCMRAHDCLLDCW